MSTQLIGLENLPNVYIEKIILTDNNTESFSVNVNLELYDDSSNANLVWSSNDMFTPFLKVCFIHTKDTSVSQGLTNGTISPLPNKLETNNMTGLSVHSLKEFSMNAENSIVTFKNKVSFHTSKAQNLDIFAFCFLDTEMVSQNFKVDLSNQLSEYYGALSSEKVFVNGKTPKRTSFYVNSDRTLWTGPVHLHQGTYMQGSVHTPTPHSRVRKVSTKNLKIIDNRNNSYKVRQRAQNKSYSIISEPYFSVDHSGGLTGIFSFDVKEFALSKTKHGSRFLGLSKALFDQFINTIQISSLKINRRQIKLSRASNKLQTPKIRKIDIGKVHLVNSTVESTAGNLTAVNEESSRINQIYIDPDVSIRSYSFTDLSKNKESLGNYEYEVEISIIDKSQDFFDQQIRSAKNNYSNLKDSVNFLNSKQNYDYISDKLKTGVTIPEGIATDIERYYELFSMINDISDKELNDLIKEKAKMFSEGNYNAKMSIQFLRSYESLISQFMGKFKTTSSQNVSYGKKNPKKSTLPNYIVVSKRFSEVINFSSYNTSYNYLGSNEAGLKVVSKEQYESLASKNVERYFDGSKSYTEETLSSINPSLEAAITDFSISKYRYFTPLSFTVGNQQEDVSRLDEIDLLNLSNLFVQTFNELTAQKSKIRAPFPKEKQRGAKRIVETKKTNKSKRNFPFNFERFTAPKGAKDFQDSLSPYINSREYLGDNSEFPLSGEDLSLAPIEKEDIRIFQSLKLKSAETISRNKQRFDVTKKNNLLSKLMRSKNFNMQKMVEAPISLKALLASRSPAARNNILESDSDILKDTETKVASEISFFAIQRIEVLIGYEIDENGRKMLSAPVWKNMSPQLLNNSNRKICRMVYEENDELEIKLDENFKFPALDKIFIISNEDVNTPLLTNNLSQDINTNIRLENDLSRKIVYSTTNTVTQNTNKMAIFDQMPTETQQQSTGISLPATATQTTTQASTPVSIPTGGGSSYGGY